MSRTWLSLLLLLLICVPLQAQDRPAGQWIVVPAPAYREAVQPLCDHRQAQGLKVVIVPATEAARLREQIADLCRKHAGSSYVLLVGAVAPGSLIDAGKKVVPALAGTAGRMQGQSSDNAFGCLDKDLLPTVAVGRLPAQSVEEARQMVQKTIAFEKDAAPGIRRKRLTVLAGVPAYNPFVDRLVEGLAMARFEKLDPSWHGRAIYHNAASRFCVPDGRLQATALRYVQDGQAFTVYFGHSGPDAFYAGRAHYLDRDDWARLKIVRGPGIFFTFGCNGCQLAGSDGEGYGLAAMRNPQGPAAVAGSHGICFASMVQLAADGLFESTFAGKVPERLGETWLALKGGLAKGKIDDFTYKLLDTVDGDSQIPQATQRQEHLEMFVLLGDPALKLPVVAQDIELQVAKVQPGAPLVIKGRLPARLKGAQVRLTVERPITSVPIDLQSLPDDKPGSFANRDRIMQANHEAANRVVLAAGSWSGEGGSFQATLTLPAKLPWPRLIVRAYATTETAEGIGVRAAEVEMTRGSPP